MDKLSGMIWEFFAFRTGLNIPNAQHSKYSDGQVNAIINDMISVLETHKAPVDLSLIALGNMASNLLTTSVPAAQREALAHAFANSLMNSVKIK